MDKSFRWKLVLLVVIIAASVVVLWPTYKFYGLPVAARNATGDEALQNLRSKALKLGLDLQGGMHMVLELDRSNLKDDEVRPAMDRAMQILQTRIDQFGVAEPIIQKQGEDRILVQLPGLLDRQRAKDLIGQTALLEFKLVKQPADARLVLDRLDRALARRAGQPADTLADSLAVYDRPLIDRLLNYPDMSVHGGVLVARVDVPEVERLLNSVNLDSILPADAAVALSQKDELLGGGQWGRVLYVLNRRAEMTGSGIKQAFAQVGLDPNRANAAGVSMRLDAKGTTQFRRVTGANVGRLLAIVLDGRVASAPQIRDRIPSGQAQITGSFTTEEARDLAIVLQAGALPAPMRVAEERTVGPSLGHDSIRSGVSAAIVGTAVVILFMLFYYRLSGAIALLAMVLNVFLLIAGMAALKGTLTLPGIAGIVLTIGMSVDANVLIFERVREELRSGKRIRAAIDAGYHRAWRTIFDANATTLVAALVLFNFGTGPIKGFAVTLGLGLVANLYTAVLVTKMIYDSWLARSNPRTLSI